MKAVCALPAVTSPGPPSARQASDRMPPDLVLLFAAACGFSVANVYYSQPLLDTLALDFGIGRAAVGGVVTATQIGSALALLLLVPLGDRLERRRLMAWQLLGLILALVMVATASAAWILLAGMLGVGLLGTAMTQGLIAYAASAAAEDERGRVVGMAQGGVFIGLLMARVFSGAVSDLSGWRGVYICSAALMLAIAVPLWRRLPVLPVGENRVRYPALLISMFTLLRKDRVLQVRGTLALLMFAAFNVFWSALVLPLSQPPFAFSHTLIGTFGLVGVLGALAAARAGAWADQGKAERTSAVALVILLLAWWPLSRLEHSLGILLIGIVLLDLGGQALHVTNQSLIFRLRPQAHSRMVGLYMLFYAVGSGLGGLCATSAYAYAGWAGVCVVGAGFSGLALLFWAVTRHCLPVRDA